MKAGLFWAVKGSNSSTIAPITGSGQAPQADPSSDRRTRSHVEPCGNLW